MMTENTEKWTLEFSDYRDFCRVASILIGAVCTHPEDALDRFQSNTLWGERTWGPVSASKNKTENNDI